MMYRKRRETPINLKCPFCGTEKKPEYKEVETLKKYLSDRAKIVSRSRAGVCAKHQRQLAREIKRARHLALLPFVTKI